MAHSFRKFISEVFVNGKFPKISRYTVHLPTTLCFFLLIFVITINKFLQLMFLH